MVLPTVAEVPAHHPDCCLSLSTKLFAALEQILSAISGPVLSIGSGTGLLEAMVASRGVIQAIEGVEVSSSVNKYLPEELAYVVGGTWDLCPRAKEAVVWIFVYPRLPVLVEKYFQSFGQANVELAIFLGPKTDWPDFEHAFRAPGFAPVEVIEDCGLVPYEMMAVVKKE